MEYENKKAKKQGGVIMACEICEAWKEKAEQTEGGRIVCREMDGRRGCGSMHEKKDGKWTVVVDTREKFDIEVPSPS